MKFIALIFVLISSSSLASEDVSCMNTNFIEKSVALNVIAEVARKHFKKSGRFPYSFTEESIKVYSKESISALKPDHIHVNGKAQNITTYCLDSVEYISKREKRSHSVVCKTQIYGDSATCKTRTIISRYDKDE